MDEPDSSAIVQALVPAMADSSLKRRWVDEVKGVDVSGLDISQRSRFVGLANAEPCTCGCGFTLAACRSYDPTCPVSLPRAEALRDSIRSAQRAG